MRAFFAFVRRAVAAVRIVAVDRRIPRPLRWLAALGLLPIPGPFDEIVLLLVALPLAVFYRRPLLEAWHAAGAGGGETAAAGRPLSTRPDDAAR